MFIYIYIYVSIYYGRMVLLLLLLLLLLEIKKETGMRMHQVPASKISSRLSYSACGVA